MSGSEKTLPVYIRVGDGAEYEVGTITADSGDVAAEQIGNLLREVAAVASTHE